MKFVDMRNWQFSLITITLKLHLLKFENEIKLQNVQCSIVDLLLVKIQFLEMLLRKKKICEKFVLGLGLVKV